MKQKINFGSEIKILKAHKGTEKHLKYRWVASFNSKFPDTIFMNEHEWWFTLGNKRMEKELRRILSHEVIHNILHSMKIYGKLDFTSHKFRKQVKRECPKTWRKWAVI